MRALEAQRAAHAIAFAPIVFQVSRLMVKYGIFKLLIEAGRQEPQGLSAEEIAERSGISLYGVKVLLESSLTAGTVFYNDGRYTISKIGWFLENDAMVKADIDFNRLPNRVMKRLSSSSPRGMYPSGNSSWSCSTSSLYP